MRCEFCGKQPRFLTTSYGVICRTCIEVCVEIVAVTGGAKLRQATPASLRNKTENMRKNYHVRHAA